MLLLTEHSTFFLLKGLHKSYAFVLIHEILDTLDHASSEVVSRRLPDYLPAALIFFLLLPIALLPDFPHELPLPLQQLHLPLLEALIECHLFRGTLVLLQHLHHLFEVVMLLDGHLLETHLQVPLLIGTSA